MKQRHLSDSPLLDPSVSALILIVQEAHDLVPTDPNTQTRCDRILGALTKAADIAKVPVFVLAQCAAQQPNSPGEHLVGTPFHQHFLFQEHSSPFSHEAFIKALTAEDRSILVLAGYWLEHEILATALHALVDGYDVYVVLDATPPRSPLASEPARDRLNQAGATPVIASQVLNEWSLEAEDASTRTALRTLLPSLLDPEC
jgi:Isochorismatase family